jgi:AcrR family transcriptional regulator
MRRFAPAQISGRQAIQHGMETTSAKGAMNAAAREIARVAARLFATHGYEATSVRMIVEEAGVTKPTLYYHFGSKEGLARALLMTPMSVLAETMRSILEVGGDPVEALVGIVEAHFAFCREDPDRARFFFALWFGPQGLELLGEIKAAMQALPELLIEGIRRLAEAGMIAPERVGACATACRGMIVIAIMDSLYRDRLPECRRDELDCTEELGPALAARLVDDLLHGFASPGVSFHGQGTRP